MKAFVLCLVRCLNYGYLFLSIFHVSLRHDGDAVFKEFYSFKQECIISSKVEEEYATVW